MPNIFEDIKLVKLAVGVLAGLFTGIGLLLAGEFIIGAGTLIAMALLLGCLAWARKGNTVWDDTDRRKSQTRLFWLGIALTLLPGPLYFYLCYGMARFDRIAMLFVGVPLLVAGLGLITTGLGLWSPDASNGEVVPPTDIEHN